MTRLAYIRSIETQQARPFLRLASERLARTGVTPTLLYTDGDVEPEDFAGEALRLDPDIRSGRLADSLADLGVDVAVSISIPDNSSLRDAAVREISTARGTIDVVAHPVDLAATFANKHETKALLAGYGIATPASVYVDGDLLNGRSPAYDDYATAIARRVAESGYPVIVKPIWDCLANGMSVLSDPAQLAEALSSTSIPGNVLLEQCLDGRLCSMEVIAAHGSVYCQPLVWKGSTTAGPEFAFEQLRIAGVVPSGLESQIAELESRIAALCLAEFVHGVLEFEFIEVDGVFFCIEVNPRVSGSTGMSIAASGVNTYWELARIGLDGRWDAPEARPDTHVAWQIPLAPAEMHPLALPGYVEVLRDNAFSVDGLEYANTLLRVDHERVEDFARWCRGATRPHSRSADDVLEKIAALWDSMAPIPAPV
ncbi:ATP-grasp domain-containing protein [Williamsia sp. M5A3_1d]